MTVRVAAASRQPSVHRTFDNGSQAGYLRDGLEFRFCVRADQTSRWEIKGPAYRSWVQIADMIDQAKIGGVMAVGVSGGKTS